MPSRTRLWYSLACPSTKASPITNVRKNHRRNECTSPRSAANTPIWQVTEDATRMIVKVSAYGTLSCSEWISHWLLPSADARIEKNIANNAAKNISSLESQTIVPTLTMLGRVNEWIWLLAMAGAAVTGSLLPLIKRGPSRGVEFRGAVRAGTWPA